MSVATVNLLGWFGHGNAGDARIAEVMVGYWHARGIAVNLIDTDPLARAQDLPRADVAVLAGGDHWHEGFAVPFSRFLSYLKTPFAVAGMGVDSLRPAMREPTEALLAKARFLWTRDEASLAMLGGLGDQRHAGPDVTWIDPVAVRQGGSRGDYVALNVRPWPVRGFEGTAMNPAGWRTVLSAIDTPIIGLPMQSRGDGDDDRTALGALGLRSKGEFDMATISRAGLVISMRLHGLIFAAQAAVPMIALVYQDKCRRFMEQIGMGAYCLGLDEHDRLTGLKDLILSDYAAIQQRLLDRRRRLHEQATILMDRLTDWVRRCGESYRA